jgi:quercetin dioxygenase-like cupin family protein
MKTALPFAALVILASTTHARALEPSKPPEPKLSSAVFEWDRLTPEAKDNGVRRNVLDGPTATVDRLHAHITTLKPGERSAEPKRHLQEEVIIVKEGTVEANFDGQKRSAGPGSVIFFAAGATTFLRNIGPGPATYTVVYYYTPLTPKS